MQKTIQASVIYFAIVLGAGFILGVVRVPFLVPRIGERWAELAEMPLMAVVIYLGAGYVLRRTPGVRTPRKALTTGLLALVFSIAAELILATLLQDRTLSEFVASRDKISGSVYVAMLLVFAAMPRLRLNGYAKRERSKV
ncbi:MAG: hypothetical protein ABIP38_04680 [Steroidobacteraceae bacterium]